MCDVACVAVEHQDCDVARPGGVGGTDEVRAESFAVRGGEVEVGADGDAELGGLEARVVDAGAGGDVAGVDQLAGFWGQ